MRAVVFDEYGDPASLTVREVETPVPRRGQVLVKIGAAAINPSDISFVEGNYGFRKPLPTVAGFEGMGVVVAANAGLYGRWLVGKRVACIAPVESGGTWAEYMACGAMACVPLSRKTSDEFGAGLFVNPLTALTLVETARRGGHKAFIQTAAASALGRMMLRLANDAGLPAIHVVRRAETAAELRAAGAAHVLCSADEGFDAALKALSHELGATIAFDPVAGDTTERLAAAMPRDSKVVVFGGLAAKPAQIDVRDLIFRSQSVEGFWLQTHIAKLSRLKLLTMTRKVLRLGEATLGAKVLARLPLEAIGEAVALQTRASEGKVLLIP